ncbi:unnamed protein product, partial [Durusdinium trenchii]
MVTPVSDNSKRASMEYAVETHSFECMMGDGKTITVEVELPLIKVVDGALAFVNEINGSSYAVLKRGLLPGEKFKAPVSKKRKADDAMPAEEQAGQS